MEINRIIQRDKFEKIKLFEGDSLRMTYNSLEDKRVLSTVTINAVSTMIVDEAVLFEGSFEDRRALGMLALEEEKQ